MAIYHLHLVWLSELCIFTSKLTFCLSARQFKKGLTAMELINPMNGSAIAIWKRTDVLEGQLFEVQLQEISFCRADLWHLPTVMKYGKLPGTYKLCF